MLEEIRSQLNLLVSAGHPIFVFGDTVVLPVEAEDFFTPEEMDDLRRYILSSK